MPASYDYRIDWANDGTWTGTGDDVSQRVRPGLTIRFGRDQVRALSPNAVGSADFDLVNTSRDYMPDNAASPIYPNVLPARPTRFQATLSGVVYTLFKGTLDEFKVVPERNTQLVNATAVDALAKLREPNATTALYPSIRTGEAIAAVLTAVGWPVTARDLDIGATTLRWWSLSNVNAWTAINEILDAEGSPALLYADGNGNICFRDRHHRLRATLNANPGFEGATSNWTATGGALALNTSTSVKGQSSGQLTPTGVAVQAYLSSELVAVSAATKVTAVGWVRCAVSRNVFMNVSYFDASFNYLTTHTTTKAVTANTWTYFLTEFTAPASTVWATIQPGMDSTPAAGHVLLVDDLRLQVASASVATFRDAGTEPLFSPPMVYDQGWRDVVNSVLFDVEERGPDLEASEVWTSDQVYTIAPSTSQYVTFVADDPFIEGDVSDYTVLSGSAGINVISIMGRTGLLQVYSGGTGGVVTGIKVVGIKVSAQRTLQVSASDSTSIATYGTKSGPSGAGDACYEDALAIAALAVAYRKVRLPIVSIDMAGTSDVRLTQCLTRKLSDRIKIIDAAGTGLNRDFFIEQIEHELPQAPQLVGHRTTFGCEAVATGSGLDDGSTVFIFDHPTNGKFGTGKFAS